MAAEKSSLPWPLSVGLWFIESKGGDRFTESYKDPIPILDRIHLAAKMRGMKAIELHYPYEATEENFDEIRATARDEGLKILSVIPGLFHEQRFKDGALMSYDKKIRQEAIDRIKKCMQFNEILSEAGEGGQFAIFWAAADGINYPFDAYHPDRRRMIQDGLIECLQSQQGNIVVEHKPSDPAIKTYFGTTGENILLCRDIREALGKGQEARIGINPEMAHLLMANADLGHDVSLIQEENMLMHTHWNTISRMGADTDSMVGSDNWNQSAEVFFWLDEFNYDGYLGLDLLPKSEDSVRAVDISIMAMEAMYNEMMSIKEQVKTNMRDLNIDASHTQELLIKARGAKP